LLLLAPARSCGFRIRSLVMAGSTMSILLAWIDLWLFAQPSSPAAGRDSLLVFAIPAGLGFRELPLQRAADPFIVGHFSRSSGRTD